MKAAAKSDRQFDLHASFSAARREQEKLRATLSPDEYELYHQGKISELDQLSERVSANASAKGLTEEILTQILAEE